MRTVPFIISLALIAIIPLSGRAQTVPQAVTVEEVNQFLAEYKTRLTEMKIDPFMDLYAKNAVENRLLPYADIREVYRKRMAGSKSLLYNLKVDSVQAYGTSAYVGGRYEIIQSLKNKDEQRVSRGVVHWDLVREDGSLKIREVTYTPR